MTKRKRGQDFARRLAQAVRPISRECAFRDVLALSLVCKAFKSAADEELKRRNAEEPEGEKWRSLLARKIHVHTFDERIQPLHHMSGQRRWLSDVSRDLKTIARYYGPRVLGHFFDDMNFQKILLFTSGGSQFESYMQLEKIVRETGYSFSSSVQREVLNSIGFCIYFHFAVTDPTLRDSSGRSPANMFVKEAMDNFFKYVPRSFPSPKEAVSKFPPHTDMEKYFIVRRIWRTMCPSPIDELLAIIPTFDFSDAAPRDLRKIWEKEPNREMQGDELCDLLVKMGLKKF